VQGSTFDAFVDQLKTAKASLPVIESEIGDTWIHGGALHSALTPALEDGL
jgi:hypothetical protein